MKIFIGKVIILPITLQTWLVIRYKNTTKMYSFMMSKPQILLSNLNCKFYEKKTMMLALTISTYHYNILFCSPHLLPFYRYIIIIKFLVRGFPQDSRKFAVQVVWPPRSSRAFCRTTFCRNTFTQNVQLKYDVCSHFSMPNRPQASLELNKLILLFPVINLFLIFANPCRANVKVR